MITTISSIEEKVNEKGEKLLIVKFDFLGKQRFCYLTEKSLEYWANKGVESINIGNKINVFEVPNTKFYKIVKFLD